MSEERARQAEGGAEGRGMALRGHHRQVQPTGFSGALPLGLCSQKEPALELGLEYWPLRALPDLETPVGYEGLAFSALSLSLFF